MDLSTRPPTTASNVDFSYTTDSPSKNKWSEEKVILSLPILTSSLALNSLEFLVAFSLALAVAPWPLPPVITTFGTLLIS